MLHEQQEVLRKRLLADLDSQSRAVTEFAEDFARNAPYTLIVGPGESRTAVIDRAFEELERIKKEVEAREVNLDDIHSVALRFLIYIYSL